MEGQHGRSHRFTVGPVYPNKSLTMCSSDFAFRKYKQDSAFRVSGVLQLAKTGPPVNSRQMLRWLEGFTHLMTSIVLICIFYRARNVAHFDSNRPFAGSSHMVRNKLHWDANDVVGLPKQSKVGLNW